ncbi:neuron-derived neurotrophic factor [Holotrichia oblita]|uniref:Neuron-derived neurotrophic factor n=1 Tax=Holotrichia oblita TaxID=644536 RepID=A0ACB9SLX9_HOLOL|nr:neuron-derived neurotrophic factor [Holotrichia oblita]
MKKSKIVHQPPALVDYPNTKLPSESQITVYLQERENKTLVDPYATTYCLVINSQRPYSTLCSAQNDVINPRQQNHKMHHRYQMSTISDYENERKDGFAVPKIICTGNKTHYTLTNLQQDMNYYFNVFAINGRTNLTYLHGSAVIKFDTNVKPVSLRDGKIASANLKKLDGKAFFTYKSEKRINSTLTFLIIPCGGGAVDVTLKYNVNRSKKKIRRLGIIQVKESPVNLKYHIKVLSQNRYEFNKASGVKILATSRASKIPFPSLPTETIVHEYVSLRKCNGVTIGWYAAPTNGNNNYCIAAKRGKLPENLTHKAPDNCKIDYEMKSLTNVSYCKSFNERSGEIIIEHIENLSPDQPYIIYVTVKKDQGKSLAYDLLQVYTKPECN